MRSACAVVSYRNSTSNHNQGSRSPLGFFVVSYRNSTSNHNLFGTNCLYNELYLIEILHQTTTCPCWHFRDYQLYLIEILHQTTTRLERELARCSCILSKFYIKPQHEPLTRDIPGVVSYRNSTSNHNTLPASYVASLLYLIEILHQTTTQQAIFITITSCILSKFYIKPQHKQRQNLGRFGCILSKFYIKPQLGRGDPIEANGCILSKFYIKPQLFSYAWPGSSVVSYRNSTSNHNLLASG